jgi:hypothetical protein
MAGRRFSAAGLVVAAVLTGASLSACSGDGSAPHPSATSVTTTAALGRDGEWRADLEALLPGLAELHPDLADGVPAALRAELDQLTDAVPTSNDDELMVGVMRLMTHVASTGRDGHTGLFVWGGGSRETHSLPLRLWFFADGLYVEDALEPYGDLIGARIVGVNGHPLQEVLRRLDPSIPHDNDSTVQLLRPRFLLTTEVLHGLGLIDSPDIVQLDVVDGDGRPRPHLVEAVPMVDYNAWAGEYGLHLVERPGLLATTRTDEVVWHELLRDRRALYIAYNQAQLLDPDEMDRITRLARSDEVDKVIVDLRRNFGGEVGVGGPMFRLMADPKVRDKRLYLLTGRNTFSAGALFAAELVEKSDVTVVGEPMGGAPSAYGNVEQHYMEHTGLVLTVATTRELAVSRHDRRTTIQPDLPAAMTFADWFAGRDTVLDAAINDGR